MNAENELLKARLDEMDQQRNKDQAFNKDLMKTMIDARVKEMIK